MVSQFAQPSNRPPIFISLVPVLFVPFSVSSLHLFIFSCIQLSSFKSPNSPLNLSKGSTTAFSAQSSPTTMVESKKKRYQVKKRKEKQKRKKRNSVSMSPTTTVVVNRTRQTHPRNLRRTGRPCLRPRIGRVHCSASVVHGNTLHRKKSENGS